MYAGSSVVSLVIEKKTVRDDQPQEQDDQQDAQHQRQPAGHAALGQPAGYRQNRDGDHSGQQNRIDD